MMLADALIDRATRSRACETALVALVALDPGAIAFYDGVMLSPETILLLDIILERPSAVRAAFLPTIRAALNEAHAFRDVDDSLCRDVMMLAESAAAVTVADLASVGSLVDVVTMLRDVRPHRRPLGIAA